MALPAALRHLRPARILAAARLKRFLVTNPTNIRYLTGLSCSAGSVLLTSARARLFVDGRYREAARQLKLRKISVHPASDLAEYLKGVRRCGFEAEHVTVARLRRWQRMFRRTKWTARARTIEEFRRAKTPDELTCIRRACAITRSVLLSVPALLKPGITERALAWKLCALAHERGAHGLAFPTIVGFGEHTSRPHHVPTDCRLKRGDIVQVDMGATLHGYASDFSRVYFTASPTSKQRRAFAALTKAKRRATSAVKAGVSNRTLDRIARGVLKQYGYVEEFSHSLGHGVGLEIHEGVTLSHRSKEERLKRGEVITIEPGLYFPGEWGMRIEDTLIVR